MRTLAALCGALFLVLVACSSAPPSSPGDSQADGVAALHTFSHPQRLGYVWWQLPEQPSIRSLEVRFTLPTRYAGHDGLYVVLAQGFLSSKHGVTGFEIGIQTAGERGRSAVFARQGSGDRAHARASAGGWARVRKDTVGTTTAEALEVRSAFPMTPGAYVAHLEWRRADPDGVWFGLTIQHETNGEFYDVGELRFPSGGTLQPTIGSWLELYSGANQAANLKAFEVVLDAPRTNAAVALSARTTYGSLPNVDVELSAKTGRARIRCGGATVRRHGAGNTQFPSRLR